MADGAGSPLGINGTDLTTATGPKRYRESVATIVAVVVYIELQLRLNGWAGIVKGVFVYETERTGIRKLGTGKVQLCPGMNTALLFLSNGKRERRHWLPVASSARMCTDLLHNAGVSIH
ncbi:hypothetical protein AOLI_G00303780 [Acnodon oligacanthus]